MQSKKKVPVSNSRTKMYKYMGRCNQDYIRKAAVRTSNLTIVYIIYVLERKQILWYIRLELPQH